MRWELAKSQPLVVRSLHLKVYDDGDRWVASLAVEECETCGGWGDWPKTLTDQRPCICHYDRHRCVAHIDWGACPARCFDGHTPVVPVQWVGFDGLMNDEPPEHRLTSDRRVALVDLGGDERRSIGPPFGVSVPTDHLDSVDLGGDE